MTKNGNKTLKLKAVLFLTVLLMLLTSAFMFTACGNNNNTTNKDEAKITYPTPAKVEDETETSLLIPYGSFEKGNSSLSSESFPYSSLSDYGWSSIARETNAPTSDYKYLSKNGLIDKDSWETKTLSNFKSDNEAVYTKLNALTPKLFTESHGNRILMLNAYCKTNIATASKATRSSSITLDKGGIYKISFDVLTTDFDYNPTEGANIQIISSVNNTSRTNGIYGIKTANEWKTYAIYVTADEYVNTTIKLSLGLGRAGKNNNILNCVEGGSAFFDNIKVEKFAESIPTSSTIKYDYKTDLLLQNAGAEQSFNIEYKVPVTLNGTADLTTKQPVALNNYYIIKATATEDATIKVNQYQGDLEEIAQTNEIKLNKDGIYYFFVKNNYPTDTVDAISQSFKIEAPEAVTLKYATGTLEDENYALYSSLSKETVALYNGYVADYSKPTTTNTTFAFNPATTETISEDKTVDLKDYKGITNNSIYLSNSSSVSEFNQNEKAGVIKVDDKQVLKIENYGDYKHYGFFGKDYSISTGSYAKISLKVKVDNDTAKAFVYIIDNDTNLPMEFKIGDDSKKLFLSVDKTEDWETLEFEIATGAKAKSFRIEMWNGSRDEATPSTGVVWFDDLSVNTSATNFESERMADSKFTINKENYSEIKTYTRELTEKEKQFNQQHKDQAISYNEKYVWANNSNYIFAVYNTIEPVEVDPFESIDDTETKDDAKNNNAGTFWLSFSSIALVAVMVLALIAIIVKNSLIKKKLNANDAVSHYTIQSKTSKKKKENKTLNKVEEKIEEETESNIEEVETQEEVQEEITEPSNEESTEETLDSYVYGDVQNFGENLETNEDTSDAEVVENETENTQEETTDKE